MGLLGRYHHFRKPPSISLQWMASLNPQVPDNKTLHSSMDIWCAVRNLPQHIVGSHKRSTAGLSVDVEWRYWWWGSYLNGLCVFWKGNHWWDVYNIFLLSFCWKKTAMFHGWLKGKQKKKTTRKARPSFQGRFKTSSCFFTQMPLPT